MLDAGGARIPLQFAITRSIFDSAQRSLFAVIHASSLDDSARWATACKKGVIDPTTCASIAWLIVD